MRKFILSPSNLSIARQSRHLALLVLLLCCEPLLAKTGVVFIHGKGSPNLDDPKVARAYWGTSDNDLVNVVRRDALTRLVCSYNGTLDVEKAADTVVPQIVTWMESHSIDDIGVVTHSFGGVVIRWILSNPRKKKAYADVIARIRWVDSIAAPNGGSEAANLAEMAARWQVTRKLLEAIHEWNGATQNCTTSSMAYLNDNFLGGASGRVRPLPRQIYTVAGDRAYNMFAQEDLALEAIAVHAPFSRSERRPGLGAQRAVGWNSLADHPRQPPAQPP